MTPYLIGISGGSASGKTFLLNQLQEAFTSGQLTLISQDNYYYDLQDQPIDSNGNINFDHPQAMNLSLYEQHLRELIAGNEVSVREYNFNNPNAAPKMLSYKPAPIIVVEGLFVFYEPKIREMLNLKVFIDADEHVRLARRVRRDMVDRGYSLESILDQYVNFVAPMYRQFVLPFRDSCDIVIPSHSRSRGIHVIINHLRYMITNEGS